MAEPKDVCSSLPARAPKSATSCRPPIDRRTLGACNRRESGRARLLKARRGPRTQLRPVRVEQDRDSRQETWPWVRTRPDSPRGDSPKAPRRERGPHPGNLRPPQNSWDSRPLTSMRNHPAYKTKEAASRRRIHPLPRPTLCAAASLCIWVNPLAYHFVSHWILSVMRHQEPEFH